MNTLQNNANDSFYTRFYPGLQAFTGNTISTLIIGKLEYWFSKPQYVGGFYKFVEPCGHPLYREGDSWSEELDVSRKLFAKAFDLIGVRYNSKSAYLGAEDKFQGKFYASYHDRKTNRTYFVRNHEVVSQILESLKTSYSSVKQKAKKSLVTLLKQNSSSKTPKISLPKKPPLENSPPQSVASELSQGRSRNGDLGRSYARGSFSLQKETSSLEDEIVNFPTPNLCVESKTEEMIKIWKEEVGELGVSSLSHGLLTRLQAAFKEFFEGSLESWTAYCQMISSSKFLMGEAQNKFFKKAWIIWAIRGENIERVRGGGFKLGDRKTNQDKKTEFIDREILHAEHKKHQIEMKISHIKSNEQEKRKTIVKDKIKNLSSEERQSLEHAFEAFLEQENNSMTEEFRKSRWKGTFISVYFDSFIEEKIYTQLFGNLDKDHDEKIVQSFGLLELLDEAYHELALIKQQKRNLELRTQVPEPQRVRPSTQNPSTDTGFDLQTFNPVASYLANPLTRQLTSTQNRLDGRTQRPLSWA